MSEEEDVLHKMDALLKRHQPEAATSRDIPMLQEVISPPPLPPAEPIVDVPVLTSVVASGEPPSPPAAPEPSIDIQPAAMPQLAAEPAEAKLSEEAVQQLMRTLDQHLGEILVRQIAPQLINSVDRSISAMMVQFNSHIEELVRDAVTSELQKYLDNFVVDIIETGNKPPADTD